MNIGILLPGFSADEHDKAIPVQHYLMRELAQHEDVRILALRYPHRRRPYKVFDARVYPLGYTHKARRLWRLQLWMEALFTLRRLHREQRFDVLHAFWADETGLIAAWAGRLLKVPVVVSVVGGELANLPGYGLQRHAFSRWIVRQALTGADAVVTACAYVEKLLYDNDYRKTPIHRIVMGVDPDLFTPVEPHTQTRQLIHAASLISVKDQVTLLRVLSHLPDDVTLSIVGDGPLRPALESLAQELNIAHRITFHGEIDHTEMVSLYHQASLHVLTSLHEGLGMVTLEAAACGVPTVGTAVGLLPDDPDLGIAVPVGDDAALAEAILSLLNNPEHLDALRQSARAAVENRYTVQHTVSQFQALYHSVTS